MATSRRDGFVRGLVHLLYRSLLMVSLGIKLSHFEYSACGKVRDASSSQAETLLNLRGARQKVFDALKKKKQFNF